MTDGEKISRRIESIADAVTRSSRRIGRLIEIEGHLEKLERARALALTSNDIGFWDHDLIADDLWWSPGMFIIFGCSRDEFMASGDDGYQRFAALVHPDDIDRVTEVYRGAAAEGKQYTYAFRTNPRHGESRRVLGRGNFERDSLGQVIRCAGVIIVTGNSEAGRS